MLAEELRSPFHSRSEKIGRRPTIASFKLIFNQFSFRWRHSAAQKDKSFFLSAPLHSWAGPLHQQQVVDCRSRHHQSFHSLFFSFISIHSNKANQIVFLFHEFQWACLFVCLAAAITAQLFQQRSWWLSPRKPNKPRLPPSKKFHFFALRLVLSLVFQYLINQKQLHQHNAQSTQKIDLISLICWFRYALS